MANTATYEFEDMSDVLDTLDETVSALNGFTDLLEYALDQAGGDLQHNAYGVSRLLDHEVTALVHVREAARKQYEALTSRVSQPLPEGSRAIVRYVDGQEQVAGYVYPAGQQVDGKPTYAEGNIEAIARLAGVHIGAATRVMFVLTGKDLAGDAYEREGDFGPYKLDRHLLERRVYDTLNSSVEWGRVSLETGLDLHTVQAVFNSMLGVPVARQTEAAPDQAHPTIDQVIDQLKGGKASPDPDQQAANG